MVAFAVATVVGATVEFVVSFVAGDRIAVVAAKPSVAASAVNAP